MEEIQLLELFSQVHRRLVRRLAPLFQAEGLSGTEILVLWKVRKRGSLRVTEVAGLTGIPPSTFTGILDRLAARGLLERLPDPGDRRGTLVRGTPALAGMMDRLAAALEGELRRIFDHLPDEIRRRLVADLETLNKYLEREEGECHGRA
ncbi:MarR family winged helix-turn-helix transcriptional regulator [Neomoorella humiferrea]|uniref:HTH-type transcriptional repressor NicR n=1 Tax=Neomoorella humiferrea TaxID=676965 RepID=A0A2T0AUU6_9FIRM|nr:MarR family transcriptional regulator [Moorella humiferrea]PRR74258.1 HTH-type transcriptional repressor NicR [Moorella humiferrea]